MSLIHTQPTRFVEQITRLMIQGYLRRNEVTPGSARQVASAIAADLLDPGVLVRQAPGQSHRSLEAPGTLVLEPISPSGCLS